MDRELPRQDEIWRHFKNKLYRIVAIAQHVETVVLLHHEVYRHDHGALEVDVNADEYYKNKGSKKKII